MAGTANVRQHGPNSGGKYPGLGGVYKPELMESYIGMGMRFILSSNDLAMMMAASTERASFLRGLGVN